MIWKTVRYTGVTGRSLSDVTSAMQVQRGLGSSKLAISSVGGTINVVTKSANQKRRWRICFLNW